MFFLVASCLIKASWTAVKQIICKNHLYIGCLCTDHYELRLFVYLTGTRSYDHVEPTYTWLMRWLHVQLNPRSRPTHDARTTLIRHRFNVLTLYQRPYNAVLTSCASWVLYSFSLTTKQKLKINLINCKSTLVLYISSI